MTTDENSIDEVREHLDRFNDSMHDVIRWIEAAHQYLNMGEERRTERLLMADHHLRKTLRAGKAARKALRRAINASSG